MLPNVRKKPSELRRFRRVPIDMPARVIINGVDEYRGCLVNLSPGDLAMQASDVKTVIGDAAVVYAPGLDIFEGKVARIIPDGFALSFRMSRVRRALLTERLMKIVNPNMAEGLEERRLAPRHPMSGQRMVCRLPDGGSLFARALDISADGVALESKRRPPVGVDIHVGRMRGIVMRHTSRGFVVVYDHGNAADETPTAKISDQPGGHRQAG